MQLLPYAGDRIHWPDSIFESKHGVVSRIRENAIQPAKAAELHVCDVRAGTSLQRVARRLDPVALALLSKEQKQARSRTSEAVVPKLTAVVDGHHQIKDNPPVLYHFQKNAQDFERETSNNMAQYRKSLPADRLALFERYQFHDAAVKVVGVGSDA